jgi:hypothetical protein
MSLTLKPWIPPMRPIKAKVVENSRHRNGRPVAMVRLLDDSGFHVIIMVPKPLKVGAIVHVLPDKDAFELWRLAPMAVAS